jgi:hypothetical protein
MLLDEYHLYIIPLCSVVNAFIGVLMACLADLYRLIGLSSIKWNSGYKFLFSAYQNNPDKSD